MKFKPIAKIVLNKNEMEAYIRPREDEDFMFNASTSTKNEYCVIWLYNKIKELEYLGYKIEFVHNDGIEIPSPFNDNKNCSFEYWTNINERYEQKCKMTGLECTHCKDKWEIKWHNKLENTKLKENIIKKDRNDLILSVQGYIKDPAIKAEDLTNEELQKILYGMYAK